ncbi:heptaprenyl diphosphate synthase component 1 [Tepidibacillus sp. LV47]|uniref:heptaprenyl diphosphate synthase component 1 n=1 Tax=Tepidibacillus sp. LV47 TaxID=3398228 RepID=UPI003AAD5C10
MMITHGTFHLEINEILTELKNKVDHIFIKKYVTIPKFPLIRLQLLNLLLFQASFPRSLRKLYCVTTGLVQMGLDVHEEIVNQKEYNEREIRSRQLSILAGDYYSSQYYSLLSKANLVDGIKRIAAGIRDVNIAKMNLYTENDGKGFESIEQMIEIVKVKESTLYLQFLDLLKTEEERLFWKKLIEDMILLSSLIEEQKQHQISRHQISYLLVNYFASTTERREIVDNKPEWKIKVKKLYHKYNIQRKIEELILNIQEKLAKQINQIENLFLKNELYNIFEQIQGSIHEIENIVKDV